MESGPSYGIRERAISVSDSELHAERIRMTGCTVVDGGFTSEDLAAIAERLDRSLLRQAERAGGRHVLEAIGEADTLRCCLAYDDAFVGIAAHAGVLEVCRALLGDFFVLTQQNGIINPPGRTHVQTAFHRDIPYQHFVSSRPMAISALLCVDDFTAQNGATTVLPGTHRVEQFPSDVLARAMEVPLEAPAGSYLVFDSMLFHRAGSNTSPRPRRAINHVYGLPFMAQQISIPDVLQGQYADDPLLGRLLGYRTAAPRSLDAWWAGRRERMR
jgi:ectoine hydroxylase-related dioxygenase (phytanoyl-CoA dioxygenase family)